MAESSRAPHPGSTAVVTGRMAAGTTVLGTTSRAATLATADRVVVLDGGRVAAVGHWRDLERQWSHLAG